MPSISIKAVRHRDELNEEFLARLADHVQKVFAESFTCEEPDGHLKAREVEVDWEYINLARRRGGEKFDVRILAEANEYPSRRANLDERTNQFREQVLSFLPMNVHGFVWVRLAPGSFQTF